MNPTRHRPSRRMGLGLAAALLATVAVAGSPGLASAAVAPFDSGAATCRIRIAFTRSDGTPIGLLRRIVVQPPTMYGQFSFGPQPVSWRFVVYKSYRYWEGNPWTVYYKSPVQSGMATETESAAFSKMGVSVRRPSTNRIVQFGTAYRVEIRMQWWYPDQSLLHSRVKELLPNMREVVDGQFVSLVMPCYYRYPYPQVQ